MTAQATTRPLRRGVCPGLCAPMPTGDGLLARLQPCGTIPLAAFAALCRAARTHGNGIIEVTSRGNIQVRGLSDASALQFADAITAIDIAADDGVPVLCNPLAGLDAEEIFDSTSMTEDLRRRIAQSSLAARLSPKVSVVIDGGGAIGLDAVAADIRLRAAMTCGDIALEVGVGGDAARARKLGWIAPKQGVDVVLALLEAIARHSRDARAREILAAEGAQVAIEAFLSARPGESADPELNSRLRGNERNVGNRTVIGTFALCEGKAAVGIGLAFGHANTDASERLVEVAETYGATGLRTAPGRALLAIGLAPDGASAFAAHAECLGFITRADDPRRKVIACAGAPICASAHIASRALAPAIAANAAAPFDGTIHVSGCAKGCAHAAAAALTVVGTADGCALIANGSVRDPPFAVVAANALSQTIADYVREHIEEVAHV